MWKFSLRIFLRCSERRMRHRFTYDRLQTRPNRDEMMRILDDECKNRFSRFMLGAVEYFFLQVFPHCFLYEIWDTKFSHFSPANSRYSPHPPDRVTAPHTEKLANFRQVREFDVKYPRNYWTKINLYVQYCQMAFVGWKPIAQGYKQPFQISTRLRSDDKGRKSSSQILFDAMDFLIIDFIILNNYD